MGENKGVGVHQSYKDEAKKGCDVLFRVKIKGRTMLVEGIPLHMSIKIFKSLEEFDLKELQEFVEKNDVVSPDPKKLTFEPVIFESEKTKLKYYMLKVEGLGPQYKALYDEYDDVGNVYKKFMTHVTIDKEIYDDVKENGLKPEDIEFSTLILEAGAGNTTHDFKKSEDFGKSDYGPKHLSLYSHAENARRKMSRTGEVAHIGPNKAVRAAGPTRAEHAERQASIDKQKSKKNPVKIYSPKERKKLARKMGIMAASEEMAMLALSENLDKGLKGDWQKEGYRVVHAGSNTESPKPEHHVHNFHAIDSNGNIVGSMAIQKDPRTYGLRSLYTHVDEEHQRKGLASAMYQHAEAKLGVKFSPSPHQEPPGKALWSQPNRSFGKGDMGKGIRQTVAGLAVAGAMAMPSTSAAPTAPPKIQQQQESTYDSGKMLNAICDVETQCGKNMNHKPAGGPIHAGESAIGQYGIMPQTVRETIKMHPDLRNKHGKASHLRGDDMRRYIEDNKDLENAVAQKHLQRLEHHFGKDPAKIGYAWFQGIRGTYKAKDESIENHWHTKKIKDAYAKRK